jgi:hypothetical protein
MKYIIFLLALSLANESMAQDKPIILEPFKQLEPMADSTPTPTPSDPTQQQQQGKGQPGQDPGQNQSEHPHSCKGEKCSHGEYEGGSGEYGQIYYSPAYISKMIAHDMSIQCFRGLCEMAMVDTRGKAFVAEVNTGYGNQNGMNGSGGPGGLVIVGATGYNNTPQPYLGVTLRYVSQRCVQSVRVPTSLFVSMNTYLYNLINEDGTTKRTFDPAEQTMILFYTTILKQATGCTTPTR